MTNFALVFFLCAWVALLITLIYIVGNKVKAKDAVCIGDPADGEDESPLLLNKIGRKYSVSYSKN